MTDSSGQHGFTARIHTGDMATDRTNEKANPERLAFSILVGPPRVELGTNGL